MISIEKSTKTEIIAENPITSIDPGNI